MEKVKLYHGSGMDAEKNMIQEEGSEAIARDEVSSLICRGLGEKKNIWDMECCATGIRCTVYRSEFVRDDLLKQSGACDIVRKGNVVQIVYGEKVTEITSDLEHYLETKSQELSADNKKSYHIEQPIDGNVKKRSKSIVISSPVTGMAEDISAAPDEVFSGRILGDGAVVTPEDGLVVAPEDGEISTVFDTKHAISMTTDTGEILLIHVGIDTVKCNGKGFEVFVQKGQKVKKGDSLLRLDLKYLLANAPSLATPVLCTELKSNQKIRLLKEGNINAGEPLFAIDEYE